MGKKTPTPPPPIDYAAAAKAQGQENTASALQGSYLSNPNVRNPYGTNTTTWSVAKDADGNPILDASGNPQVQANIVQALNPEAQNALEAQQRVQSGLSALAETGTAKAKSSLENPFQYNDPSYSGPRLNTAGPTVQSYSPSNINAGDTSLGPAAGEFGLAAGIDPSAYGQATGQLDLSNVSRMPVNAGMTGQNAILFRLAPQIQQTEAATAQRLANQGITPGSEAYNNAMRSQGQQANDLYTQAALQGINLDIGANQQGFGQALSSAGLYNQAIGQNFGQGLAGQQLSNQAIGQNFGQGVTSTGLQNAAQAQKFNQDMAQQAADRAQQNQIFNQQLQQAQFGNAAEQANLQTQMGLYNQPLNQINALMSGSQIQNPTFQAYSGSNVAAAPVFQAAQQTGQDAQAVYAQQVAAQNAQAAAIGGLFGAAGTALSGSNFLGG